MHDDEHDHDEHDHSHETAAPADEWPVGGESWETTRWGLAPREDVRRHASNLELRLGNGASFETPIVPGHRRDVAAICLDREPLDLELFEEGQAVARWRIESWQPNPGGDAIGWPPLAGRWLKLELGVGTHNYALYLNGFLYGSEAEADRGGAPGEPVESLRFVPVYLGPEREEKSRHFSRGFGFFPRGVFVSGDVLPLSFRLAAQCDEEGCREPFTLRHFHAGFSNQNFAYCDAGTHLLTWPDGIPGAPPLLSSPGGPLGDPRSAPLAVPPTTPELEAFEAGLPPCRACDGKFRYYNPLRCPKCHAPYIDYAGRPWQRQVEYYALWPVGGPGPQHWPEE